MLRSDAPSVACALAGRALWLPPPGEPPCRLIAPTPANTRGVAVNVLGMYFAPGRAMRGSWRCIMRGSVSIVAPARRSVSSISDAILRRRCRSSRCWSAYVARCARRRADRAVAEPDRALPPPPPPSAPADADLAIVFFFGEQSAARFLPRVTGMSSIMGRSGLALFVGVCMV